MKFLQTASYYNEKKIASNSILLYRKPFVLKCKKNHTRNILKQMQIKSTKYFNGMALKKLY